jgi:hypothetical protein
MYTVLAKKARQCAFAATTKRDDGTTYVIYLKMHLELLHV